MAITFRNAASANSSSVAITTPSVGDTIIVFAYNNGSTTIPTLAAGYTSINTNSTTLSAASVAYKVSDGTETTSGTWTNATNVVAEIYRGCAQPVPAGASASTVGNSVNLSYPTITLQIADGTSWVTGVGGAKAATAGMNGTTAALTQNRTSQTTVNGLDTNAGVSSFAAQTLTVTTSGRWITFSVELLQQAIEDGAEWFSDIGSRTLGIVSTLALTSAFFASSLCAKVVSQPQDEVPATVVVPAEELYWQNHVPFPSTYVIPLPNTQLSSFTAPFAYEEYWQNPTPPVPLTLSWPQQFTFDEQTPSLFPQPDEDFWTNPVAPVPLVLAYPQQFSFDEQTPSLFPQPDEDFWANPTAPVQLSFLWPQQGSFDEQFPVLFGQHDEDFWQNPVLPQLWAAYPQPFLTSDDDSLVQQPVFSPDEDYWFHQVWPARPFVSGGAAAPTVTPIVDEDYWLQPLLTQYDYTWDLLFFLDDGSSLPAFQADEDFYWQQLLPAPAFGWPVPQAFTSDEFPASAPSSISTDEDFWQNPVVPVSATFGPLYLPDTEQISATGLHGQLDEDYWQNYVSPIWGYPPPIVFRDDEMIIPRGAAQIIWLQ